MDKTTHSRSFVRLLASLVLAVGLAIGVLSYVSAQSVPGASQISTIATDTASQQASIEDTITRANTQQAQALSSSNPSLMSATATAEYLQELTQVNQQLAASGVSSIALISLDWGPISVNGDTARAVTYETWTTALNDGTTLQSRDENDYSLVLENGTWKIASDAHPGATATDQPASGDTSPTEPATSNASNLGISSNWSGYAASSGTYTAVSGTWTVPAYTASTGAGVSATWVGIGGVTTRDLIQAGTQQQTSGNGQTMYQAWIEMLPQASRPVPLAVTAGDSVSVSIAEQAGNTWLISFDNRTTGQTYQQIVTYASSHSSAEWIQEAPSAARAGILPLDNFGTVSFDNATTVKNGQSMSLAEAGATGITMVGANRQTLAVPSSVGSDGDSFTVSRTSAAASPHTNVPSHPGRVRSSI